MRGSESRDGLRLARFGDCQHASLLVWFRTRSEHCSVHIRAILLDFVFVDYICGIPLVRYQYIFFSCTIR